MLRHGEESEEKTELHDTAQICMVSPCRKKNIGRCKGGRSLEKKKKIKNAVEKAQTQVHTPAPGHQGETGDNQGSPRREKGRKVVGVVWSFLVYHLHCACSE